MSQNLSKNATLAGTVLLSLALMPAISAAQEYSDVQSNGPLHLSGIGSFFIQGDVVLLTDIESGRTPPTPGNRMINQMYVQFMKPQAQNGKKHAPIVFVHGGGLTSKSWQTTPDGRMGWDEYFVRQGFDTYLGEQVARGRSGFDARTYNNVRAEVLEPDTAQPAIRLSTEAANWNGFRWGTTPCTVAPCWATTTPHPGIRFPMNTVGVGNGGTNLQFMAQGVPGLNGTLSGAIDSLGTAPADPAAFFNTPAQMAVLAKKIGGAILVGHSESSAYPIRAALQPASGCYPWTSASACKVKGIIQLETGCFGNLTPAEITTLSHIPILIEFGDFSPVPQPAAPCPMMMNQITAAGGDIKFAWIPALTPGSLYSGSPGPIFGNEHMIMLDNNNLQIADILIGWATSRGL
jgi:pimeloyl-ACP methyl ester carboxylesterase